MIFYCEELSNCFQNVSRVGVAHVLRFVVLLRVVLALSYAVALYFHAICIIRTIVFVTCTC